MKNLFEKGRITPMNNGAKEQIKDTFLKLLDERPLSQITVKDIVSSCGINRNTFYYHYSDLPTLIEEIITDEVTKITSGHLTYDNLESCLGVAISFAIEHKKAVMHLYNSGNRDIFVGYCLQISEHVISRYLTELHKDDDMSSDDLQILIHFCKCLVFGQIIDWIRSGMTSDLQDNFRRFCEMIGDGSVLSDFYRG